MKQIKFKDPEKQDFVEIDMREETQKMASRLNSEGYRFEIGRLPGGKFHMDCSKPGSEGPVAVELCDGASLANAADRLVRESHDFAFGAVEFWDEDENPEEFWK